MTVVLKRIRARGVFLNPISLFLLLCRPKIIISRLHFELKETEDDPVLTFFAIFLNWVLFCSIKLS